jgi:hypothetical protein
MAPSTRSIMTPETLEEEPHLMRNQLVLLKKAKTLPLPVSVSLIRYHYSLLFEPLFVTCKKNLCLLKE